VTYAEAVTPGPMPRAGRQVRLEPARRALHEALGDLAAEYGLTRADEIELLTQALTASVGMWRKGKP
jgi:hypothetical protein